MIEGDARWGGVGVNLILDLADEVADLDSRAAAADEVGGLGLLLLVIVVN